jgi:hypothetical protein
MVVTEGHRLVDLWYQPGRGKEKFNFCLLLLMPPMN